MESARRLPVVPLSAHVAAYHPETTDAEYVEIYRTMKDRWLDTLTKFDRFPDVTTAENYERLALIIRENLDDRFGPTSTKMKRKWYTANRLDDLTPLSTTILRAYHRFLTALYPEVLIADREILVEYVDLALDLLSQGRSCESQPLLSALSSLARKNIIRIPALPTSKRQ